MTMGIAQDILGSKRKEWAKNELGAKSDTLGKHSMYVHSFFFNISIIIHHERASIIIQASPKDTCSAALKETENPTNEGNW